MVDGYNWNRQFIKIVKRGLFSTKIIEKNSNFYVSLKIFTWLRENSIFQ